MAGRDALVALLARLDAPVPVTTAPAAHERQRTVLTSTHGQFWSSAESHDAIEEAQCAVCAERCAAHGGRVAFVLVSEGCSSWCALCSECLPEH